LSYLGLADEIKFEQLDKNGFDRMVIPGYDLKIPGDSEELVRRLKTACSDTEHKNVSAFVDEVIRTADGLNLASTRHKFKDIRFQYSGGEFVCEIYVCNFAGRFQ
jgi:all-trans-retinol 13,14-reductase